VTVFADTGYFVALAQPRDEYYARAHAWSAALVEPLIVTEYVLWEMFNWFSKPEWRTRAHQEYQYISTAPHWEVIPASPDLFAEGVELHANRPDKAWSLTDCISFIVMEQRQITRALTPDRHFEQAGFEALLLRDPT
jgi:hypothetical protein